MTAHVTACISLKKERIRCVSDQTCRAFRNTKTAASAPVTISRTAGSLKTEATSRAPAHTEADTSMDQAASGIYRDDPDRLMNAIGNSLRMAKRTQNATHLLLLTHANTRNAATATTTYSGPNHSGN